MATETPRILVQADRLIGRLAAVMALIGGLGIAGLVVITLVAVLWRYGFNNPIFGIADLSVVTLTLVAGASVAYGARHGAHVSVNVLAYVADRRLMQLGLPAMYNLGKNPLPWLDEILNGVEHTNFFENRATEYSKASTRGSWDEAFD